MSIGRLKNYGLSFQNVVASGVATANVTPGRSIDTLTLKLGGTTFTKAMITLIKVKANGRTLVECSGTELDKINAYRGLVNGANYLDIPFFDEKMMDEYSKSVTSFDSSNGVGVITVEVTIAGATAPTLQLILWQSAATKDASGNPSPIAGVIGKILRYPWAIANGGTLPITVPFGPQSGAYIKRLHVFNTNMTGINVKQDSMPIHESLAAENSNDQTKVGRVPQAGVYTIDFVQDGNVSKCLNTRDAKSLEWLMAFSAADSGNILVEYMDALGNL
jgi:hypothetical protein